MDSDSFGRKLKRLFTPHEKLEAADLTEASVASGFETIAEVQPRDKVRLRGIVKATTTTAHGWLEAELSDGTGQVTLIWMGHPRLEAVLPGRTLAIHGRLGKEQGRLVVYNPEYEVVP